MAAWRARQGASLHRLWLLVTLKAGHAVNFLPTGPRIEEAAHDHDAPYHLGRKRQSSRCV
jgi:hypothetical protein